jgi:hypothetical protein
MLDQLRSFEPTRLSIDELVALSAFGRSLVTEFAFQSLPTPEWLSDRMRTLQRAISSRVKDQLELRLKEIQQQEKTLMTPSERRDAIAAERKAIEEALAKA